MIKHRGPRHEVAEVIDAFIKQYHEKYNPNTYVTRTLWAIQRCRTPALGGHVDQCKACGHIRISYNSCRNRHCPKCQNTNREAWIESRKQDLLPVLYFHVVFTVPEILNPWFLHNPTGLYNLQFQCAWETIHQFFITQRSCEGGMIGVLHTWGQTLSLHPHIHCIIPGGGIDYRGKWKGIKKSGNGKSFLFGVEQLSTVFRGKFIAGLKQNISWDKALIDNLYKRAWVVYAKEPFAGPEQVIEYLGRYTHKVAISNHRLNAIREDQVDFTYRDYRDQKVKNMKLPGVEFLRRFSQHILPKGFVRIRHYGILSTARRKELRQLQRNLGVKPETKKIKKDWKQLSREYLGYDPDLCPHCGKAEMVILISWLPGRAPPNPILNPQVVTVK